MFAAEMRGFLFFGIIAAFIVSAAYAKAAVSPTDGIGRGFASAMVQLPVPSGAVLQPSAPRPSEVMIRQKECIAANAAVRRAFGVATDAAALTLMRPMIGVLIEANDMLEDTAALQDMGMAVWGVQRLTATRRLLSMVRALNVCAYRLEPIEVRR